MNYVGTEGFGALLVTAMIFLCANGEVPAGNSSGEMIPCQAAEDIGSAEGVETRGPSSNSNDPQERPTSNNRLDEDIVRYSGEIRRAVVNSLRERMLDQVSGCGRKGHTRQWRPCSVSCECELGERTMSAGAVDCYCANGETPAEMIISEAIPCQAAEDFGSAEGVETREPSSNGNAPHECPTSGLRRMMI